VDARVYQPDIDQEILDGVVAEVSGFFSGLLIK
jgi:hypothetical protein